MISKNLTSSFESVVLPSPLFEFHHSYLASVNFDDWWSGYFTSIQKTFEKCFLEILDGDFLMQTWNPEQKTQGKHSFEIVNFEKYFKISYDPFHLEKTVREESEVLREKNRHAIERFNARPKQPFLLKLPRTKPPFPKFPHLPNAPFGLAKSIPGLEWFLPFKFNQACKLPKEKQITTAKYQETLPFELQTY